MKFGNRLLAAPAAGVPAAPPAPPLGAGADGDAGAQALSSGSATAPARAPARNPRRLTECLCCTTSSYPLGSGARERFHRVGASSAPGLPLRRDSTPPGSGSVKLYLFKKLHCL